jgi:hypothetical protein
MTCFAIIIGTATHLVWDGLTHLDFRTFAFKDLLAQNISIFGLNYPLHFICKLLHLLWLYLLSFACVKAITIPISN